MSYCRWSSDNWRCDIYCYASVGDFYAIHVAGNRVAEPIPEEPSWDMIPTDPKEFARLHNVVMDYLSTAERHPIGLPHDGETFEEPTAQHAAERLRMLRAVGYRVPDYAIQSLDEDAAEEAKALA